MASYEELLAETGKEYLTPTEFKILNERKRSGTLEDMFMEFYFLVKSKDGVARPINTL